MLNYHNFDINNQRSTTMVVCHSSFKVYISYSVYLPYIPSEIRPICATNQNIDNCQFEINFTYTL